ncbi:LexA family transcriptional regulator [Achromobacter marplatensis]|uniref:LexA family transcriptional regulator n=1 Tax=Achromobacter marplatensis TaxID=470868 RepID=A0AA43B0T8_9BURK|nr:LexA family transcriptional regulator [Achromobacter marplatensis]MDH2051185.1 LexA family transcriptional regulator [Achromobacter marplatensis]
MSALKDRLAEARTEAGLSQAQLAKAVGAGQSTIASIENGRNKGSSLFLDLARALNVNVEWLMDGAGPKKGDAGASPSTVREPAAPWPFPEISERDVRALPPAQLNALQGALALAIAQLKLGVNVAPVAAPLPNLTAAALRSHKPGGLVDMDHADDAFPMRIPGLPAPWEGGRTTAQAEREPKLRLSTQDGVVANVGPGEPHAANDKFEKVPELADVRLAAGDGIENADETQTGVIQFRRSFLRSVGADAGKARVVYAKGDSMEPVIKDGAALLVVPNEDLTLRDLAGGGVYAINYDGKMIVKTVAKDKLTGRWVARSFNPAYPDIPLENGHPARVLGQVVWAGARLRDDEAGQWVRS